MSWIEAASYYGIEVFTPHFTQFSKELGDEMESITSEVQRLTGSYTNLDSPQQVSDLLFKKLGLKQARRKMTKSGIREAADNEVLEGIKHQHPIVPLILDFKEGSKLRGTYCDPILKLSRRAPDGTWRLFPNFKYTRVPSGRFAAAEPNLLAIPAHSKRAKRLREGFITKEGWVLVTVDLSQIEPRVAAHRSNCKELIRIYENDEDLYSDFAITAFKLKDNRYRDDTGKWKYPHVDKEDHRFPAKTCTLASLYDVTGSGLLAQMPVGKDWTENKCQDLINSFYMKFPELLKMRRIDHARARSKEMVWCLFGRILHTPGVKSVLPWVVSSTLRELANHPIQCVAKHTHVFVRGRGLKTLGSLIGERVTIWDGQQWATGDVVPSGKKKQVHIKIMGGMELYCSPDHKILTVCPDRDDTWTKASHILNLSKRNTKVAISGAVPEDWDWNEFPPTCDIWDHEKSPCDLTWCDDEPYLFGEMLGRIASDGGVLCTAQTLAPKVTYMLVADHEKSILPLLNKAASLTSDRVRMVTIQKPGYAPMHKIEIYSKGLAKLLLDWDIKDRIPEFVWKNSKILRGYLRGYFDGDGGIVKGGMAGPAVALTFGGGYRKIALAKDVQQALLILGIRSRLRPYETRIGLFIQRASIPVFNIMVGFINQRKKDQLTAIPMATRPTASYGESSSIHTVEVLDECEMVDFVNSTTGRFSAEGMIVHNSTACGIFKLVMASTHQIWEQASLEDVIHPLLPIHDELLYEVREDLAEEWIHTVGVEMENCCKLRVPIKWSGAQGRTWAEVEK